MLTSGARPGKLAPMPRAVRLEFPGAIYHVFNRGNYRKELFADAGGAHAFEKALLEVAVRDGWKLHAYAILSNHFHLAVETPNSNLVAGMQWLEGTFASRFNRFHKERGHVFQGRYKALVVQPGPHLLAVVDYVHLNPVRAGLCKLAGLKEYPFSSYQKFFRHKPPEGLERAAFLTELKLPDSLAGMNRYAEHLQAVLEKDPARREELDRQFCRGWFLGEQEYREALIKQLGDKQLRPSWHGPELQAMREAEWESMVEAKLRELRKDASAIEQDAKSAPWKVEIARFMRANSNASNPWLAQRLNMGHPSRVSNLVHGR